MNTFAAIWAGAAGLFVFALAWINPRNIVRNRIERGALMCVGFTAAILSTIIVLGIV